MASGVKTKGITIPIGIDQAGFNRGLRRMSNSIKATEKTVNELENSLKIEFDESHLIEAQKKAQEAIEKTEEKAKALKKQMDYAETVDDFDPTSYEKMRAELVKTESHLVKLKDKLNELNSFKLTKLAEDFENVGNKITTVGQALTPISAAAAAVVASLTAIGTTTASAAGELEDLGKQVNLSAEALQEWQYVANMAGVDSSTLQNGLIKAQSAFADLAAGTTSTATTALENLGISASEAANGMGESFDLMIERLTAIEDPMIQASIANDVFGDKMGAKLIPLLKEGGDGLAQFKDEFKSFGALTNDQVHNLAELDDSFERIKAALSAVKNQLAVGIAPVLESVSEMIETKMVSALKNIVAWFNNLSSSTKGLIMGVMAVITALAPLLLISGKMISGIGGVIKSVSNLGAAFKALATNPILAAILGVITAMTILYAKNENFRKSVNALFETLSTLLTPSLNAIVDVIKSMFSLIDPFIDLIGNSLAPVLKLIVSIINSIAKVINGVLEPVLKRVVKLVDVVVSTIKFLINSILGFIETAINGAIKLINFLIKQINKLGDHLGFTIDEIQTVKLQIEDETKKDNEASNSNIENNSSITDVINNSTAVDNSSVINNYVSNDNSDKNITLNVTVENYAEKVDWDNAIEELQLRLAKEF